jgi:hypothetical protein
VTLTATPIELGKPIGSFSVNVRHGFNIAYLTPTP